MRVSWCRVPWIPRWIDCIKPSTSPAQGNGNANGSDYVYAYANSIGNGNVLFTAQNKHMQQTEFLRPSLFISVKKICFTNETLISMYQSYYILLSTKTHNQNFTNLCFVDLTTCPKFMFPAYNVMICIRRFFAIT